ncbi:MAG: hypothetical protein IJT06_01250 [Selenomonadaceae bacterium]|nr:hypothetical protein [Selenomonadaceae bacterium]
MENFAELTEKIFRQTYGFPSENLTGEELDKVRAAVIELRNSYASNVCKPLYQREEIRKAYMFSYYPYYVQPVYEIISNVLRTEWGECMLEYWGERAIGFDSEDLGAVCPIELTYIAGGPCPELYGTVKALKDIGLDNDIYAQIYDIEEGWRDLQNITLDLCKDCYGKNISLTFSSEYNALDSSKQELEHGYGILFIQNYLSHVVDTEKFMRSFESLLNSNRFGEVIILDLNYNATRNIFERICDKDFLSKHRLYTILKHTPDDGDPIQAIHEQPSRGIQKIFNSELDIITYPKKYTKYYYLAFGKLYKPTFGFRVDSRREELK